MPNYLDNLDVYDANGDITNVLLQDRGTLALANALNVSLNALTVRVNNFAIINVKDYGATGDEVTDDYSAIMDAIDASDGTHKIIYFPSGTYLISDTIDLLGVDNLAFVGDGNSTVLKASSTKPIFKFNTCHYITIKNMTLDRATAYNGDGIVYHTGYWSIHNLIENVNITHQATGIYTPDSRLGTSFINKCVFNDNTNGAVLMMNNDVFISDCIFSNNTNTGLAIGGSTTNPSDGGVWCVNCMAYRNAIGVALNGTSQQHVVNFNWTGGIIDASTGDYASVVVTYAEDVEIDTKISWGDGVGILASDSTRVRIKGEISDCNKDAISLFGTCTYFDIDCDISSIGASQLNTYHGINAVYGTFERSIIRGIIYNRPDKVTIDTGVALGENCSYITFVGAIFATNHYYSDDGTGNTVINRNMLNGEVIATVTP